MDNYIVLKNVVIEGSDYLIGDEVEISEEVAVSLLNASQIAVATPKKTTDRSVGLSSSEGKKVKKRAKKK